MTLEKYVETTPKGFYLMIEGTYVGGHKKNISAQDLMKDENLWKYNRSKVIGAVDSVDPPDGYDQARVLHIEKGFDLCLTEST